MDNPVFNAFAGMVEAQAAFYASPSNETMMVFIKTMNTLQKLMAENPSKNTSGGTA